MGSAAKVLSSAVLILAFATIANGKGKKQQDPSGVSGRLVGVSPSMIMVQQKGDPNGTNTAPTQVTIKVNANTTVEIDGVPGKRVTDLRAGEHVVIQSGNDGFAADIQASTHKRHHKNAE